MNIYDKILKLDKEDMAKFLYEVQEETIRNFMRFWTPSIESCRDFLEREVQ